MKIFKRQILFDDVVYYSLLLFAFTLPLSKAAISFFIFWFLILAIVKGDYKNSLEIIKSNKIFLYIALFIGFLYLSLLWTEDFKTASGQVKMFAYWIIVPSIVILAKKKWTINILNAFIAGMLVSEIISYGMYFELWSLNSRGTSYPVPFMYHIHYSVFLAFTSLILLYRFLFKEATILYKIPFFIFFLLTTTNLMLSVGRTGQLAFFLSLFIVFFMRYKISVKSFLFSVIIFSIILFGSYNSFQNFKVRVDAAISDVKKIGNNNFNNSFGIRVLYWKLTIDSLKENPLLGNGIGDFKINTKQMLEKYKYEGMNNYSENFLTRFHYHNQYLMIIVQSGLIGFLLMILLLYKLFTLKIEDKEIKNMSVIGLCVISISFIAEPLLIIHFTTMLFLFIVSLSITASRNSDESN